MKEGEHWRYIFAKHWKLCRLLLVAKWAPGDDHNCKQHCTEDKSLEIHKRMVLKLTRCNVLQEIITSLNVCRICGVFMIVMSIFPRFDDFDVNISQI